MTELEELKVTFNTYVTASDAADAAISDAYAAARDAADAVKARDMAFDIYLTKLKKHQEKTDD
jgi:hypothetical protein